MIFTKLDLKPLTDYLKEKGHGAKGKVSKRIGIHQSQLTLYIKKRRMTPERFNQIINAVKELKDENT